MNMGNTKGGVAYVFYILLPVLIKLAVSFVISEAAGIFLQISEGINDLAVLNARYAETGLGVMSTGLSAAVLIPYYYKLFCENLVKCKKIYVNYIVLGVLLSLGLNMLISYIISYSGFNDYSKVENILFSGVFVLRLLCLGIIVPVCEELLFRGVLIKRLTEKMSYNAAIFVSAFLFGVYHMNLIQFCYAFMMGIIMGFVMKRENNIFAPVCFHMGANVVMIVLEMLI